MSRRRLRKTSGRPPGLTIKQILSWADDWHQRSGKWPQADCGAIPGGLGETWAKVEAALRQGHRGLPGGSSLARLLEEQRGARNRQHLPPLKLGQILTWADEWRARTGGWPKRHSGEIPASHGETWANVNTALIQGQRGLPGGSSLPRLLAQVRGVRNEKALPPLTVSAILAWARKHHQHTGHWPTERSGAIAGTDGETWSKVTAALQNGCRGLQRGSSLAKLLHKHFGVRQKGDPVRLPPLSEKRILTWADAYQRRTGRWPHKDSGTIRNTQGQTWSGADMALRVGTRGFPGGSSLARLLARERDVANRSDLPHLRISRILAWADAHRAATGKWPTARSGPVRDAPGEIWYNVSQALRLGLRGLPGDSSLALLLAEHRSVPYKYALPHLSVPGILGWADAYHRASGEWPTRRSGFIENAQTTWLAVDTALNKGNRGLPGGSSLARLLKENGRTCR